MASTICDRYIIYSQRSEEVHKMKKRDRRQNILLDFGVSPLCRTAVRFMVFYKREDDDDEKEIS